MRMENLKKENELVNDNHRVPLIEENRILFLISGSSDSLTNISNKVSPIVFLIGTYINFLSSSKIFFINAGEEKLISKYYLYSFTVSLIFFITLAYLVFQFLGMKTRHSSILSGDDFLYKSFKDFRLYLLLFVYYTVIFSSNNILNCFERPCKIVGNSIPTFFLDIAGKIIVTLSGSLIMFFFTNTDPRLAPHRIRRVKDFQNRRF